MLYDPYATTNLGGVGSPAAGIPGAPGNLGGVGGPAPRGGIPATSYTAQIDPQATMLDRVNAKVQNVKNMVSNQGQRLTQAAQKAGINFNRSQMLGFAGTAAAAAPLAGQVIQDVQAGRTLDAAVTGAAGLGVLGVTETVGKAVGGGKGALIRGAGALLSPVVGNVLGNKAEQMRSEATGVAPADASPVEERRATQSKAKQDAALQQEIAGNSMNMGVSNVKDLMAYAMNQRLEEAQKMIPTINRLKNDELVRQQALNASNLQNYMAMGVVATAGKIAQQQVRESGANLRTAMQANPYANSVLQAPNISF